MYTLETVALRERSGDGGQRDKYVETLSGSDING